MPRWHSFGSARCRVVGAGLRHWLTALAYGTGLRRAEIVALDLADYNPESGELLVRRGKGGKARTVYVAGGAAMALDAWVEARGSEEGALFHPYNRGGKRMARPLNAQTVRDLLEKR